MYAMQHKERLVILIAVLVLAAGFLYWYFALREQPVAPPIETEEGAQPASLGEQLLEKAQNPIKGEVPKLDPVTNPIEGLYKNPFK